MTIGSLFAGIGGLELGLEWAGLGPTVWQVESDPYCRVVLARHWPQARRFCDVEAVSASELCTVDIICGGFPCQDTSSTGRHAGLAGPRSGLWFEFARIVEELRPAWVVVENVASGAHRWVDVVCDTLARLGYACLPIPLAAADVGAPHARERVFIVAAHADAKSQHARSIHASLAAKPPVDRLSAAQAWRRSQPAVVRVVDGFPDRLDRVRALGNAVVPQCAQVIGHVIQRLSEAI